jgi:starch synthase
VVRAVGGLADTVEEFDPRTGEGTGFTFEDFDADDMMGALRRAVAIHRQPELWRKLQRNGMAHDFSWRASAAGYDALYAAAIARVAAGGALTLDQVRAMI